MQTTFFMLEIFLSKFSLIEEKFTFTFVLTVGPSVHNICSKENCHFLMAHMFALCQIIKYEFDLFES